MSKHISTDEIICPDCKGNVVFLGDCYQCKECKEVFLIRQGIHILLPKHIEQCKISEDRIWRTRRDSLGLNEPAWKALVNKADMMKSFDERILSTYAFQGKVLELGAGCCWGSALVETKFPRAILYATDFSSAALQKGREVCRTMQVEVNYLAAVDAENIPFRNELFDAIFSIALLHHLPFPIKALNEIRRVLKPTGFYVGFGEIMSSKLARPFYKAISGAAKRSKELGVLENVYTSDQWQMFLEQSGFAFFDLNLHKTKKYRRNALGALYYGIFGRFPEVVIRNILFSTCWIFAKR